jgi:hypothetical protein
MFKLIQFQLTFDLFDSVRPVRLGATTCDRWGRVLQGSAVTGLGEYSNGLSYHAHRAAAANFVFPPLGCGSGVTK